jgi:glycerophosphoryl diester phosphodiesterase
LLWESPTSRKHNTRNQMSPNTKHILLTAFLFLTAVVPDYAAPVEIIAHRGASHDAPENTLASIRLAWKKGADGVEIDVMLSRDGQIVLFHDKGMKRLAGVDGKVSDRTQAELARLDVGKWKHAKWTGERIPLLSEALATIPADKRMFVELKTGPEIVPELKKIVTAAKKQPAQIVFISFDYEACRSAKQVMPEHEVAYISRYRPAKAGAKPSPSIASLIKRAKAANLESLDLDGNGPIGAIEAGRIKAAGLHYYVWTINDPKRARQLIKDGVEGITTDRPGWLREQLAK